MSAIANFFANPNAGPKPSAARLASIFGAAADVTATKPAAAKKTVPPKPASAPAKKAVGGGGAFCRAVAEDQKLQAKGKEKEKEPALPAPPVAKKPFSFADAFFNRDKASSSKRNTAVAAAPAPTAAGLKRKAAPAAAPIAAASAAPPPPVAKKPEPVVSEKEFSRAVEAGFKGTRTAFATFNKLLAKKHAKIKGLKSERATLEKALENVESALADEDEELTELSVKSGMQSYAARFLDHGDDLQEETPAQLQARRDGDLLRQIEVLLEEFGRVVPMYGRMTPGERMKESKYREDLKRALMRTGGLSICNWQSHEDGETMIDRSVTYRMGPKLYRVRWSYDNGKYKIEHLKPVAVEGRRKYEIEIVQKKKKLDADDGRGCTWQSLLGDLKTPEKAFALLLVWADVFEIDVIGGDLWRAFDNPDKDNIDSDGEEVAPRKRLKKHRSEDEDSDSEAEDGEEKEEEAGEEKKEEEAEEVGEEKKEEEEEKEVFAPALATSESDDSASSPEAETGDEKQEKVVDALDEAPAVVLE